MTATGGSVASGGTAGSGGQVGTGGASTVGGGSGGHPQGSGGGAAHGGATGSGGSEITGGTAGARATGSGGVGAAGGQGAGGAASEDAVTIVPDPSWNCGMANGIPAPTSGELLFQATLQLGATQEVGDTQYGHRRILDVKGGTVTGSKLQASFLAGGFELELALSDGSTELEQIDVLRAGDGTLIYMRGCGVAPAGASGVRIVPDFEVASSSALSWLNTAVLAGTRVVDSAAGTVSLTVYDVSKVTAGTPKLTIVTPTDHPHQPWDCSTATGAKGASVFTENVTLGSSLSIGASKRGTRNIIPITGGTVSGRFMGSVVSGGGDYQLVGSTTKLDARYVLSATDGVFVLVRNCGPIGSLVPWFETPTDGAYAFLNDDTYVSSDPGTGSGGVSITFYEKK